MSAHRLFAGRLYAGRQFVVTLYQESGVAVIVLGPGGRVARSIIYSPGAPLAASYVPGSSLTEVQD